jgi:hypothetical protein
LYLLILLQFSCFSFLYPWSSSSPYLSSSYFKFFADNGSYSTLFDKFSPSSLAI